MKYDDIFTVDDEAFTIEDYITEVPDFPVKGVNFKDISPLLKDQDKLSTVIHHMGELVIEGALVNVPDYWVGIDARGFIFASALATHWGGGVVMCRKKGKLPPPTISYKYETEYSEDEIEIKEGSGNVIIVDDVLATGGTLQAVNDIVKLAGYNVMHNLVLMDLQYVPKVNWFNLDVRSLVKYESVR